MLGSLRRPEIRIWLAIMGASTLILGTAYAMVQQSTRLGANDAPKLTAQMVRNQLQQGSSATEATPANKSDLNNELGVFVIITDESRHVLASSAELNGKTPLPPTGTFDYTKQHGSDAFTWQPADKVRLATYMSTFNSDNGSSTIITGQSLKLAEDRVGTYGLLMIAGWLAVVAWTSLLLLLPVQKIMVRRKS